MKKTIKGDEDYIYLDIYTTFCPFCNKSIKVGIDDDYKMVCEHYKSIDIDKDGEFVFEKKEQEELELKS